jgi:hypothetical protein
MTNNWQIEKYSVANVPQIPGGVTDKHWSMIENLRQTCRRFLVVWLTNIDLWSKICGKHAADSWWCDWQTLIYDQKSAANVPQIPGGVTDRRQTTDGRCNPALLCPQIGYIMSPLFAPWPPFWPQQDPLHLQPFCWPGSHHGLWCGAATLPFLDPHPCWATFPILALEDVV